MLLIFIFYVLMQTSQAFVVCDDPTNCNVDSTTSFANVDSVTYTYNSPGITTVGGVNYDLVLRWNPEGGAEITHSWKIVAESRRVAFDCSTSKMWFNGITVGATGGFTGSKNNIPTCSFDMQNGILTSSYLSNPGSTVFFLFDSITSIGNDIYIDKDFTHPIIPSDNYDPSANDVTMVCIDPLGPNCNPTNSLSFAGVTTVQTIYPQVTSTIATDNVNYDYVVQWTPEQDTPLDSGWEIYPERRQNTFDCTNTKMWFNGTVVGATSGLRGSDPYCTFDMTDGVLGRDYIAEPGRTVFFLFSATTGVGDGIFITKNFEKPLISVEDYVDPSLDPTIVCNDPLGPDCNVEKGISFASDTTPVTLTYNLALGSTIATDLVTYDYVVKWVANPTETLTYSFQVSPDRTQDPFDCTGARIWVNGSVFPAIIFDTYCVFDIQDGVLPQSVIDSPYNQIYFMFNTLLGTDDVFYITRNTDKPIVSVENYDPISVDTYVCDSPTIDCNVISTVSFVDDTVPTQLTYSTLGPTVVGGVSYDSVVKWVAGLDETLTFSWEVYPDRRQDPFDCSNSKVWINGTIIGATSFLRGAQNNDPYCVFDIQDGVLPQAIINDPSNKVYFLFNNLIGIDDIYYVTKNTDKPVISIESIVFYLYEVETFTISSDNTGSILTFEIADRNYDSPSWPGPDPTCNDQQTIMNPLIVGTCTLSTSDVANGVFTYNFPSSIYEVCANGRETSGNDYIYTVIIELPGIVGSCNYFDSGDRTRTTLITISQKQVDPGTGVQGSSVELGLLNYTIDVCPQLNYVLPRARSVFTLNYTFTGEAISLAKTPYLDTINDPISVVGTTCTTFSDGTPNTCIYTMKSSICRPLLSVLGSSREECAFESTQSKTLFDLDVTQIIDPTTQVAITTEFPLLTSPLAYETFGPEICQFKVNPEVNNVTSQFKSTVKIRNRPYPQWNGDTTPVIKFYEDIIIQVELTDSGVSANTQVHIQSVIFHLYDPKTGEKINEFIFNKADKELLHTKDWTRFYDDVHFCSYRYDNGTCDEYYNVNTERVSEYTLQNIIPQIDDVCQLDQNQTINDHFSFSPSRWFKRLSIPQVDIELQIISLVVSCEAPNRRLLTTSKLNFIGHDTKVMADTPVGPQMKVYAKVIESSELSYKSDNTSIIVILVLFALFLFSSFLALRRTPSNTYVENEYLF